MADEPQPQVDSVFEPKTGTWQYIVSDPETKDAAIIDSVLDFDPATNTIGNATAEELLALVAEKGYNVVAILETHAHADHLTAAAYLQQALVRQGRPRAPICIGRHITQVQATFAARYGVDEAECAGAFDRLLAEGDEVAVGRLAARVISLPGHTPDSVGYVVGGADAFVGDSLFQPDVGSARCDFPGGDARALFRSVASTLYGLPEACRLHVGHDYPPAGRAEPRDAATVAEQRSANKHVRDGVAEDEFVAWRAERDASLAEPRLMHQSLQFNIRAGRLPPAGDTGQRLIRVPLKVPAEVLEAGFTS